jgi:hypothetical protein
MWRWALRTSIKAHSDCVVRVKGKRTADALCALKGKRFGMIHAECEPPFPPVRIGTTSSA